MSLDLSGQGFVAVLIVDDQVAGHAHTKKSEANINYVLAVAVGIFAADVADGDVDIERVIGLGEQRGVIDLEVELAALRAVGAG
ncbi:hypothetical protein DN745_17340 [Bradymonas sediminis]|uniref:Uncharacterized protein n=1 Tax=Bradymonas sediminis TaxID=1548548 RepID=A0A2Z4FQQ6_9DELT|nr:hypothetical protein DN745_17340 [Bradymonas sediminis]